MKILISEHQYKSLIGKSKNLQEVLADDIPDYMKNIIQKRYKGDYLNKDVPQHTDKIPNVKVEIKNDEIVAFASNQLIKSVTDKLVEQIKKSEIWIQYSTNTLPNSYSFVNGPLRVIMDKSISPELKKSFLESNVYQKFTFFYSKEFRLPDSRLNDDSTLKVPIDTDDVLKPPYNAESVKWSNNKTGLSGFLTTIKRVFPETFGYLDVEKIIRDKHYFGLREPIINYQQNIKKIGEYPLFLYITDKPDDKLRMSISQFYDSCQNIYTGGDQGTQWNKKLLSNVFDKNSKVAYLIYNKPYKDTKGNEHPFTSIARTILRVNKEGGVMFDKVYPSNLENIFYNIITESTGIKNVGKSNDTYDYENVDGLPAPYMDKYKLKTSGGSDEDKINVLMSALTVNAENIRQIDDERFDVMNRSEFSTRYTIERYVVITFAAAVERSRDIMRENFVDLFEKEDVDDLYWDIIDPYHFINDSGNEAEYDDYIRNGDNMGPESFISDVLNIKTIYDMDNYLTKNKVNSLQWFSEEIDMNGIINRYNGKEQFARQILTWSHDEVGIHNGFVYYRTNYEIAR
jgi:hypothetical protein